VSEAKGLVLLIRHAERELPFAPGSVFRIGRHEANNLVLDHKSVSRFHVRLTWARGQASPQVRDEGSHNGTFLDGRRLDAAKPIPAGRAAELRVGDIPLELELVDRKAIITGVSDSISLFSDDGPELSGELAASTGLVELLRELEVGKRTGTLLLDLGALGRASLTFYMGKVMGADLAQLSGLDAAHRILRSKKGGSFRFSREFEPQSEPLGYWPSDLLRRLPDV
jgi:hypothetical protein